MNINHIILLLWPSLLLVSFLPILLMISSERRYSAQMNFTIFTIYFILFISIYSYPPLYFIVRWFLTILGFSIPLSLGVIAIQYIVEETSSPL